MGRPHNRQWGQGSVVELAPGKYRAYRARVRGPDGKSRRPSKAFDDQAAAERWALGEPEPTVLYFGQWIERYLALKRKSLRPNTLWNYRRHAEHCADLLIRPLADVATDDLQERANALLDDYTRADVANWRSFLSAVFRAAVVRGLAPSNPAAGVTLPKAEERAVRAWSREDVAKLVAAAAGHRHAMWLLLMLGTGIRLGESRPLLRTDIDIAERTVTISKAQDEHTDALGPTKSGKVRVVDIPDEIVPMLVAHLARLPARETLVFPSSWRKGPYTARAYQSWIRGLCKMAGVAPLTTHSLRHTYATIALDSGVPLKEVSEQLGHSSVAVTANIYSHNVNKRSRRAAAALGSALVAPVPAPIREIGAKNGARERG